MFNPAYLLNYDNGYFKVIEYNGKDLKYNAHTWKCECRCGKVIILRTEVINSKSTKSCGCSRAINYKKNGGIPNAKKFQPIHGLSNHPLFRVWSHIIDRCHKIHPSNRAYKYYRGKGIKVCYEWLTDFKKFYDWALANGWQKGLTIDRIDPEKDYEPNNCQFITQSENSRRVIKNNFKIGIYNSLLDEDKVREIKKLLLMNMSGSRIANKFGVHRKTIYMIRDKKTWKHI